MRYHRIRSIEIIFTALETSIESHFYKLIVIGRTIYIGFKEVAKPENLAKLSKDKDIIVYCDTGHEQSKALSVLRMLGYKAYDMKWGYTSWKTAPPTAFTVKAIEGSILNNYPVGK
ncbi:MAG: rhodanese-like domain-containing protein [Nitrospiraceae bacterium]|nr:rhodanese-like domain-containing protein [Nitrospiraceae bacterium]